jgi:hypothetical protein
VLTERDRRIIALIHRFGFLTAQHVAGALKMSRRMAYRRLQVMVRARYLRHRRFLVGKPGVYWATSAGRDAVETDLPKFTIRLSTMPHHLLVADVALALSAKTGGTWITERELRSQAGQKFGVGYQGHVPDGALVLPDGKRIAVEVENAIKPRARLDRIFRAYLRTSGYDEVWFVCRTARAAERVREAARKYDFAKIYLLEDVVRNDRPEA